MVSNMCLAHEETITVTITMWKVYVVRWYPVKFNLRFAQWRKKKHEAITVSFSLEIGSICHKFENIIPGEILKSFHPRNRSSNTPILTWCHGRSLHFCQSVPTVCPLHCRLPGIPGIPLCGRGWWICVDQKWIVDLPWIETTNKNCQEQWNMMKNDGKLLDYVDIAWYSLVWDIAT